MPDETFVNAIDKLAVKAAGRVVEIGGVTYATSALHDVREPEPAAAPLELSTLASLVDYLGDNSDQVIPREYLVHVVSPTAVRVVSALRDRFRKRETVATVECVPRVTTARSGTATFTVNEYMAPEAFVVKLRTCFADGHDRATVIRLVGNVREESVRRADDDGISQEITTRKGRNLATTVEVKNPVVLAPFRTFPELKQSAGTFLIRLTGGGEDKLPEVALFEADGGKWALDAKEEIKTFLVDELDTAWVVLA